MYFYLLPPASNDIIRLDLILVVSYNSIRLGSVRGKINEKWRRAMLVIASNLTSRDPRINRILRKIELHDTRDEIRELARECVAAGADILDINLQQHHDRAEVMAFLVKTVQDITDLRLCLSTGNAETLKAGLKVCKRPPWVNYVSIEQARLRDMLPLVTEYGAGVVLLVGDAASPGDAEQMVKKAAILVGAANELGIPNDSILIDPGLIHITGDIGQRYLGEVMEFLKALPELFAPPIKSTCWLGNASVGAPARLRPVIETALLAMLSGLGLSSVFIDVLKRENMRAVRLIKVLQNEVIYSAGELEL